MAKKITIDIEAIVRGLGEIKQLVDQLVKLQKIQNQADKTSSSIDKVGASASSSNRGLSLFAGGSSELDSKLQSLSATLNGVAQGMKTVGTVLTASVTAPVLAAGVAATKLASDLQTQVANISAIRPDLDTSKLFSSLNQMQTRIPQSITKLGDEVYDVFSSIDDITQESALVLTEKLGRGATAALTDVQTFGTSAIGVLNAYHLSVDQVDYVMDVFFNTVNRGVVTGAELAGGLGELTSGAKLLGVNIGTLGALIAGVTKEGGSAAENMTYLNNVFNHLGNSETQKKLEKGLGVEVFDKATKQARPILDVLTDLKKKLDELSPEGRAKAIAELFPDIRGRAGVTKLLSQLDFIKKVDEENKQGGASTGAADAAFQKQISTFKAQFTIFLNTMKAALTEVGAYILPFLTPILQQLSALILPVVRMVIDFLKSLPTPLKVIVASLGVAAVALGPILLAVAALLPIIAAVAIIGAKVAIIVGAAIPLLAALAAIISGAVIAAVIAWRNNFLGIQETTQKVFAAVKAFVLEALNEIHGTFTRVLPVLQSLVSKGLAAIEGFWQRHGETVKTVIASAWNIISAVLLTALRVVGGIVEAIARLLDGDLTGAFMALARVVSNISDAVIKILFNLNKLLIAIIVDLITSLLKALRDAGASVLRAGAELFERFIQGCKDAISGGIPGVQQKALELANSLLAPNIIARFYAAGKRAADAYNKAVASTNVREASTTLGQPGDPSFGKETADSIKKSFNPWKGEASDEGIGTGGKDFKGSGGKKGGGKKERFEPLDAEQREQDRQDLENERDRNRRSLEELQRNLDQKLLAVRTYFSKKRSLLEADVSAEITLREADLVRLRTRLASIPAGKDGDRERDQTNAEIKRATEELARLKLQKADVKAQVDNEELQRLKEIEQQYRRNRAALLELQNINPDNTQDGQRKADQIGIDEELGEQLKELRVEIAAAESDLKTAKASGDAAAQATASNLLRELRSQLAILEALKSEKEAAADLSQINRELEDAARRRGLKEQALADEIAFSGLSQEEQATKRLEIEREYKREVDAIIARLQQLATLSLNPEFQKLIERLKGETKNLGQPTLDAQREAAERRTRLLEQQLQNQEANIQDRVQQGVLSEIRSRQQLLQLHRQTAEALLKALQAELEIARAQKDPERAAEIERRMRLIQQSTQEEASFGDQLQATAEDALASGLTQFFTDVATGAKSAKDAALDFVRSFLTALLQLIIRLIVTKILMAALGFAGGGGSSGGSFIGGTLSDEEFGAAAFGGGFASGGGVAARSGGQLILAGEAGYDEMVLTSDPRYKNRTRNLLSQFITATGIFPEFARGGLASGRDILRSVSPRPMAQGGLIKAGSLKSGQGPTVHIPQNIYIQGVTNPQEWEKSKQTVSRDISRATQRGVSRVS